MLICDAALIKYTKNYNSAPNYIWVPHLVHTLTLLKPRGFLYSTSFSIKIFCVCPHSIFMCFVWIWEQTAATSLYSVNWSVFVTETECIYCAVRTEYIHKFYILSTQCIYEFFCGSQNKRLLFHYTALTDWFLLQRQNVFTARYGLNTFINSTFCPHSIFMCFVWISEQTAVTCLYCINWLVFAPETKRV